MVRPVTAGFTLALPKVELHAHLTGSISRECLHEIWKQRQPCCHLPDPLLSIRPEGVHHDIFTFFKLFDTYIYELCNDPKSVSFCTTQVLKDFESDGVCYLELRTTPREAQSTGLTKDMYVSTVLDAIEQHGRDRMSTYLILSIDRRNTYEQAMQVVELAIKYRTRGVVGVDLCGNPLEGDVTVYQDAFNLARSHGLRITLHFAEMPQSSTEAELQTLLSYSPDRIGHVINVPQDVEAEIERLKLGLELCLSCNVHAKMIPGSFADHHFGKWRRRTCPIALSTDDVGIFGSTLSNEYWLAAEHFRLDQQDLVDLSRQAMTSIFGGEVEQQRLYKLLNSFENDCEIRSYLVE